MAIKVPSTNALDQVSNGGAAVACTDAGNHGSGSSQVPTAVPTSRDGDRDFSMGSVNHGGDVRTVSTTAYRSCHAFNASMYSGSKTS